MKKILSLIFLIFQITFVLSQTNQFKIEEKFTTIDRAKKISDSLKLPVLVTDKYVFSIGEICYKRLLEGSINDRENGGDIDDREKGGSNNDRKTGGGVADRKKSAKNNDRANGGDNNDRNNGGNNNDRDADGSVGNEPHCSNTNRGKILLYTRHKISKKSAFIFYSNQTFNHKYFKINEL